MVAHTPDVLDTTSSPLPEGTGESALLDAFLSGLLSLVAICVQFRLSLGQFRAWLNSPRIQSCLESAADLTARRQPFLDAAARQAAAQGFTAITQAIPRFDPSAPPDLKRDALHARMRESARKAAGQLLRMLDRPVAPGFRPVAPSDRDAGRETPRSSKETTPGKTPGRAAERSRTALTRAMDARHPLAAAAGR